MESTIGTCAYCGRTRMLNTSGAITTETADTLVTETCECEEARYRRSVDDIGRNVHELMLSPDAEAHGFTPETEQAAEAVISTAHAVASSLIMAAQLTLLSGDTVKIAVKNGIVAISRTRKIEHVTVAGGD